MNLKDTFLKGEERVCVPGQVLVNLDDCTGRPEDMQNFIVIEVRTHDPIKADEMIDVVVRDEHGFQITEAFEVQSRIIPAVKQQRVVSITLYVRFTRPPRSSVNV